jgi:hypothetical protein
MKCPRCGNLVLEMDDACVRCGVHFVDKPVRTNPLPARIALVLALVGAAVGLQSYKMKNPISRVGGELDRVTWAGMGGGMLGAVGYAFGVIVFGRKKYD